MVRYYKKPTLKDSITIMIRRTYPNNDCKKFVSTFVNTSPGTVTTTHYFLRNLQKSPVSQSVVLHKAVNACPGQARWLK
jgi:hypothetical protein